MKNTEMRVIVFNEVHLPYEEEYQEERVPRPGKCESCQLNSKSEKYKTDRDEVNPVPKYSEICHFVVSFEWKCGRIRQKRGSAVTP